MSSIARRRLALAASAYASLWLLAMAIDKLPESASSMLPASGVAIVVGILGPPGVFIWSGSDAWMFVLTCILIVAVQLLISRFLWRRYPDSELFGLPVLGAGAVWIGAGWFAALVASI